MTSQLDAQAFLSATNGKYFANLLQLFKINIYFQPRLQNGSSRLTVIVLCLSTGCKHNRGWHVGNSTWSGLEWLKCVCVLTELVSKDIPPRLWNCRSSFLKKDSLRKSPINTHYKSSKPINSNIKQLLQMLWSLILVIIYIVGLEKFCAWVLFRYFFRTVGWEVGILK